MYYRKRANANRLSDVAEPSDVRGVTETRF